MSLPHASNLRNFNTSDYDKCQLAIERLRLSHRDTGDISDLNLNHIQVRLLQNNGYIIRQAFNEYDSLLFQTISIPPSHEWHDYT